MTWSAQELEQFRSTRPQDASDELLARWVDYLLSGEARSDEPSEWHGSAHTHGADAPSTQHARAVLIEAECTSLPVAGHEDHGGMKRGSKMHNLWHIVTKTPYSAKH